jgi:DDE family transposase
LIANTTTITGLTVRCDLDLNLYSTKLTDQQKESIPITRHEFHGEWELHNSITPGKIGSFIPAS